MINARMGSPSLHSPHVDRDELSVAQQVDQWMLGAYAKSNAGIYNAAMYLVQYVWPVNMPNITIHNNVQIIFSIDRLDLI
jgi:hypothetical protein